MERRRHLQHLNLKGNISEPPFLKGGTFWRTFVLRYRKILRRLLSPEEGLFAFSH